MAVYLTKPREVQQLWHFPPPAALQQPGTADEGEGHRNLFGSESPLRIRFYRSNPREINQIRWSAYSWKRLLPCSLASIIGDECHGWKDAENGEMSDLRGQGLRDRLHETPYRVKIHPLWLSHPSLSHSSILCPFFVSLSTYLSSPFAACSYSHNKTSEASSVEYYFIKYVCTSTTSTQR